MKPLMDFSSGCRTAVSTTTRIVRKASHRARLPHIRSLSSASDPVLDSRLASTGMQRSRMSYGLRARAQRMLLLGAVALTVLIGCTAARVEPSSIPDPPKAAPEPRDVNTTGAQGSADLVGVTDAGRVMEAVGDRARVERGYMMDYVRSRSPNTQFVIAIDSSRSPRELVASFASGLNSGSGSNDTSTSGPTVTSVFYFTAPTIHGDSAGVTVFEERTRSEGDACTRRTILHRKNYAVAREANGWRVFSTLDWSETEGACTPQASGGTSP